MIIYKHFNLTALSIEKELKRLQLAINDALWEGNGSLAEQIQHEINRLTMLQSYGETHDVPF